MSEPAPLAVEFARTHPDAAARAVATDDAAAVAALIEALPPDAAPALLLGLPPAVGDKLLDAMADDVLGAWLSSARVEDAVRLALRLRGRRRARLVTEVAEADRRRQLEYALGVKRDTLGALADPDVPRAYEHVPLGEAVASLRGATSIVATGKPVVVIDGSDHPRGLLDPVRALVADQSALVRSCLIAVDPLPADTALETARAARAWLQHRWLPVVGRNGGLLGVASRDRVLAAPTGSAEVSASVPLLWPLCGSLGVAATTLAASLWPRRRP